MYPRMEISMRVVGNACGGCPSFWQFCLCCRAGASRGCECVAENIPFPFVVLSCDHHVINVRCDWSLAIHFAHVSSALISD